MLGIVCFHYDTYGYTRQASMIVHVVSVDKTVEHEVMRVHTRVCVYVCVRVCVRACVRGC